MLAGGETHLMRATLWQVLNVPNLPSTSHTLAALLELKCVDRQRWQQQQTRALELLYKAVQRRSTSSGE